MALSDKWQNLKGIYSQTFEIGIGGPLLSKVIGSARLLFPKELRWIPDPGDTPAAGILQTDSNGNLFLGSATSSFPVKEIQSSETVVIPVRQEMALHGGIIIDGTLQIDGCLVLET